MHEVAIAEAIVELVAEHAARDAFRQVRRIHLAIGALSHVDPRALEFGFAAVASGTVADGATLVIDRPPGVARCLVCQADVAIAHRGLDLGVEPRRRRVEGDRHLEERPQLRWHGGIEGRQPG